MALIYDGERRLAMPRRKLTGTRHEGARWTRTVRALRKAVKDAVNNASWRSDVTSDAIGMRVLDHLHEHDTRSLHVLDLVDSMLVRASSRH
jgi:hypothetical protein